MYVSYFVMSTPIPNNATQIEFFNELFHVLSDFIDNHNCQHVIVGGDVNLVFNPNEAKNRTYQPLRNERQDM